MVRSGSAATKGLLSPTVTILVADPGSLLPFVAVGGAGAVNWFLLRPRGRRPHGPHGGWCSCGR